MLVNCFLVNVVNVKNLVIPVKSFDAFYAELGNNIPTYQNEVYAITGLFAVAVDSNVKIETLYDLCEKYNYIMGNIYQQEISEDDYNRDNTVCATYDSIARRPVFLFYRNSSVGFL